MTSIRPILAAVLALASCAAVAAPSPAVPGAEQAAPALLAAVAAGAEKACAPMALTLSGSGVGGHRLFVSASVANFLPELRKTAKGPAKLSKAQSSELARVLDYAKAAQSGSASFPREALDRFASKTGLSLQAETLCVSRETISSR
jgi:hypothetical protein